MKFTKSGFPIIETPHQYLYHLYRKKAYGSSPVSVHCSSDEGVSHIHALTWLLSNNGYITHEVDYDNDQLFKVRLTMKGLDLVEKHRESGRRDVYAIISIVLSFFAAAFAGFLLL
jgi:DNA polymerase IIIc chi subunit